MKNRNIYLAEGEISKISLDAENACITITTTGENELKIEYENAKGAHISLDENVLNINYGRAKRLLARRKKQITLHVPEHFVPELEIRAADSEIEICGGSFGRLELQGDSCRFTCENAYFTDCSLSGTALDTLIKGTTVKNALIVNCGKGDMVWENSFAACTDCHVKRGNIGLSGFNCKDSVLSAEEGNVSARLDGDGSDYNLGLLAKEGTANMDSVSREGAVRTFKAYSARGNIAIDFTELSGSYGDC